LDLDRLRGFAAMEAWDPEHPERWVHNDLETVALTRFPELAEILVQLKQLKAWAQGISGSGPTIFGLFATQAAARTAAQEIKRTFPGWMALCRGLTGQVADALWENQIWML
jgi:4-diphosphocytidyl-2C-methyl-D-erythritol kinase